MIIGASAFFHDASISVVNNNKILFASGSERFSKIKNDKYLCPELITHLSQYEPSRVVYYENPVMKKLRQIYSFQLSDIFLNPKHILKNMFHVNNIETCSHHESHAALAFHTSPYKTAAIMVIDAIGEFETITIWQGSPTGIVKLKSYYYPNSIGLLYSAFAKRLGLIPNKEEYIMMGMAGYGRPVYFEHIMNDFIVSSKNVHKGISDVYLKGCKKEDIACSVNEVARFCVMEIAREALKLTGEKNLCYGGGVALNCSVNSSLFDVFENVHINSNPGDAGSSLGCILAKTNKKINFTPYLGYNIRANIDPREVAQSILRNKAVGIAHGRAEFGPRALGNRSILADASSIKTKKIVNNIKGREQFRPLAPVVMQEYAEQYFECHNRQYPYMQFTVAAKDKALIPAAVHVDNTCRLQTVNYKQNPLLYSILYEYNKLTGIPVLINTSLNIKNRPLLNDYMDKQKFSSKYSLKVF